MKSKFLLFSLLLLVRASSAQYVLQPVFSNLPAFSSPTELQTMPDGTGRMIVLEQRGRLWIFDNTPTVSTRRLFFDGRTVVTQNGCEAGLLGCAFHPDYANNHFVYLSYDTGSDPIWYSQIVRYQVSTTNPDSIIPSSAHIILTFEQDGLCNHKGGCLRFGPDGYLYASFGDGGGGGDPFKHGQDRSVFFGKILRLDVDHEAGGNNYAIPADNPFTNNTQGFKKEIFCYGMRNTWKFSFDKPTGKLWAGDVGQDAFEEIDILTNGGNYGWNIMEGYHCYPNSDFSCDSTGMIPPIWEYPHPNGDSRAITGGFVYHGTALPSLAGKYVYGDYVIGTLWALTDNGSSPATNELLVDGEGANISISSLGEDQAGEIYGIGNNNGKIYKLTSTAGVGNNSSHIKFALNADRTYLDASHLTTYIHFTIPENQHVTMTLIDEKGNEIRKMLDREMELGEQSLQLNMSSFTNGIYFVQFAGSTGTKVLKLTVQK